MHDSIAKERIVVYDECEEWPYLDILYSDLERVQRALDRHGIEYWLERETISIDDGPEMIGVNFPPGTDPHRIQMALDSEE